MRNVWLTYVYYGITAVSIAVMFLSVKYLLGGYQDVVISLSDGINYIIAGKYVDESWTDEQQSAYKAELEEKLNSSKTKNRIVEVAFFPDSVASVSSSRFIGIAMQGNVVTIPAGYKVIDIQESEALAAILTMHPWVRPSLKDIRIQMNTELKLAEQQLDERMLLFAGQKDSLTIISGIRPNDPASN